MRIKMSFFQQLKFVYVCIDVDRNVFVVHTVNYSFFFYHRWKVQRVWSVQLCWVASSKKFFVFWNNGEAINSNYLLLTPN